MGNLDYQVFYTRKLPHIQPPGATLFITFRLANSMPIEELARLAEEARRAEIALATIADSKEKARLADEAQRRLFGKWDRLLDSAQDGPFWLKEQPIAALVFDSLRRRDGAVYDLDAFCLMPNHVHLVCTPCLQAENKFYPLAKIMHSLKRYTAREANKLLKCEGDFWQHENYDHVVRDDEERERIINYVLNNPVAAGLAKNPQDWKWSYCKYPW